MVTTENIQNIYDKYNVKPSRAKHSLGVAQIAVSLAEIYKVDTKKAWLAGALHDIARNFPEEKLVDYCLDKGITLNEDELRNNILIHGKVAVSLCEHELGIKDREVLEAINTHTCGFSNLNTLQKILYIADFLESTKEIPEHQALRKESELSLDKTMKLVNEKIEKYLKKIGSQPSHDFLICKRYYEKY